MPDVVDEIFLHILQCFVLRVPVPNVMLSDFEVLLADLFFPKIFYFLYVGTLLVPIHHWKHLQVLHVRKIVQLSRYFSEHRSEFVLAQDLLFFLLLYFCNRHSIQQRIHELNVIFKLFDVFFTLMIKLGERKTHVLSLKFFFLKL